MRILTIPIVSFIVCALPVSRGFVASGDVPGTAGASQGYLKLDESEPVKIGSLEFSVAVEKEWVLSPDRWREIPVEVQLHIINHGDKDVLFPTCETFTLMLYDTGGKLITSNGERDHTIATKSVLVPAGGRYCLCRNAKITWIGQRQEHRFVYDDGTGSGSDAAVPEGNYTLKVSLANSSKNPQGLMIDGIMIPFWTGKGETKEVGFEVIQAKR